MNRLGLLLPWIFLFPLSARVADEVSIGTEKIVASGVALGRPRAAFGAGVYLVVWQDGWSGLDAAADIKGMRLATHSLELLDQEPLLICGAAEAQELPAVAFAKGVFLVVWQDFRNGRHYQVRGRIVDAQTGQMRGKEIAVAVTSANQLRPAVASDGRSFFVVWQETRGRDTFGIRGIRLSPMGDLLDREAHEIAAMGTSPTVSTSLDKVLVAWTNQDRNRVTTSAALLDPVTGRKSKDLGVINSCCGNGLQSAGDGQGNFVTVASRASHPDPWGWGGPGAVVLSRVQADGSTPESKLDYAYRLSNLCSRSVPNVVDAAVWKGSKTWDAGAVGGFPGTQDGLWPTGSPAVASAGRNIFLFAWVKGSLGRDKLTVTNLDVWVRGMDAKTLAVRVTDQKAAAAVDADETHPVLVAGPEGEILLLYERLSTGAPRHIAARRIDVKEAGK
ncbi:MAG: hypothetical protein KatS3mg107_0923 [Gemmataceae bacterium]|jgi:hypothetical protein|nr:MAG: hypothetical protein KatS3mg107_0923 [Gemmataceae bacterium]